MDHDPACESTVELLRAVRKRGYRVSARQLARWHRAGILPRPVQRSLGRGKGTISVYPPETRKRLLSFCGIHKREYRLDYAVWKLWWGGDDNLTGYIRPLLWKIYTNTERLTRRFIRGGALTQRGLEAARYYQDSRLKDRMIRRVRKRVGRTKIPTLVRMIGTMASEEFQEWADPDDPRILGKALTSSGGLKDAFIQDLPFWRSSSQMIRGLPDTLKHASENTLVRVRDTTRKFLMLPEVLKMSSSYGFDTTHPQIQMVFVFVVLGYRKIIRSVSDGS